MSQCDPNNPCAECRSGKHLAIIDEIAPMLPVDPPAPEIVRQTSGPFKGRVYERVPGGGLRRRHDIESKDAAERKAAQVAELHKQLVRGGRRRRQVEEMSAEDLRQEIRDEVTRNPRASDFEPTADPGSIAADLVETISAEIDRAIDAARE